MSGRLKRNAPMVSKAVLKRTHISSGKTFTCKIAGTAKLLSASTNVRTDARTRALRDSGQSSPRIRAQPVTAMSLSS